MAAADQLAHEAGRGGLDAAVEENGRQMIASLMRATRAMTRLISGKSSARAAAKL